MIFVSFVVKKVVGPFFVSFFKHPLAGVFSDFIVTSLTFMISIDINFQKKHNILKHSVRFVQRGSCIFGTDQIND